MLTLHVNQVGVCRISDQLTYQLGRHQGETIFLHCTLDNSWENPEKFVLEVYYKELKLPEMEEIKHSIARIDNKSHGGTHLDREFKQEPDKKFRDWSFYSAWEYLEDKWRKFTTEYLRNHG